MTPAGTGVNLLKNNLYLILSKWIKEGNVLDRKEKKKIRMNIIKVLDKHCGNCMMRTGHSGKYCIDHCDVTNDLKKLSKKLNVKKDIVEPQYRTGKWTNDEEFYLLNHMHLYPLEHLSNQLNRDPQFVFNKMRRILEKQKNKGIS